MCPNEANGQNETDRRARLANRGDLQINDPDNHLGSLPRITAVGYICWCQSQKSIFDRAFRLVKLTSINLNIKSIMNNILLYSERVF